MKQRKLIDESKIITRKGCVIETKLWLMVTGEIHEEITMYCLKP